MPIAPVISDVIGKASAAAAAPVTASAFIWEAEGYVDKSSAKHHSYEAQIGYGRIDGTPVTIGSGNYTEYVPPNTPLEAVRWHDMDVVYDSSAGDWTVQMRLWTPNSQGVLPNTDWWTKISINSPSKGFLELTRAAATYATSTFDGGHLAAWSWVVTSQPVGGANDATDAPVTENAEMVWYV